MVIDWETIYRAAVLAAAAILFGLGVYAVIHSGRLGVLADLFLRLLAALVDRVQAARADYKAAGKQPSNGRGGDA